MAETMTLRFGITGEFITKIAREWFFLEGKEYKVVEELLLSCMGGTDTPEGELKLMAQDILLGKAEFRGNSTDDTFRYVTLDTPAKTNLFTEYSKVRQEVKRLKNALADTDKQYGDLIDALRLWWEGNAEEALEIVESHDAKELLLDLMALYDQVSIAYKPGYGRIAKFPDSEDEVVVRKTTGYPLLDSYFEQKVIEEKHADNYGWLEPNGTFHPVEWCEHQDFAYKTIEERGWMEEYNFFDKHGVAHAGDFLTTRKGWVLLHNPGRGVAYVTRDECRYLTKAQMEFLFGYFTDRTRICLKRPNCTWRNDMIPDFKYYARPGSQHQPCLQCTGHDPTYCPSYKSCVYYKSWLKQCWNAFRKATGIKRRCSA